jgi:hypothetical protein
MCLVVIFKWALFFNQVPDVRHDIIGGHPTSYPAYSIKNPFCSVLYYTTLFRCLFHERDWHVGEMIPDQIIHSVQSSRRTIILLTKVPTYLSVLSFKIINFSAAFRSEASELLKYRYVISKEL